MIILMLFEISWRKNIQTGCNIPIYWLYVIKLLLIISNTEYINMIYFIQWLGSETHSLFIYKRTTLHHFSKKYKIELILTPASNHNQKIKYGFLYRFFLIDFYSGERNFWINKKTRSQKNDYFLKIIKIIFWKFRSSNFWINKTLT